MLVLPLLLAFVVRCGGLHDVFNTKESTLWRGSPQLRFRTTYAGGTVLEGFICSDLIDVGGYASLAPFGCITHVKGVIDGQGIAGFGPASRESHGHFVLPPVFRALANVSGQHGDLGVPVPKPMFTFMCDDADCELQLGGYVPASVISSPVSVRSLSKTAYTVPITSMHVGHRLVLEFAPRNNSGYKISGDPRWGLGEDYGVVPGILDSGATCLCLPDHTRGGQLTYSPWRRLTQIGGEGIVEPLSVEIDGKVKIEIPASVWLGGLSVQGCPARECPHHDVVLGDWFFRAAAVVFDWSNPGGLPGISVGIRNSNYTLKAPAYSPASIHVHKRYPADPPTSNSEPQRSMALSTVGVVNSGRVALLVPAHIGWPPQRFELVFDTGSSFFGVLTAPTHRVLIGNGEVEDQARKRMLHDEELERELEGGGGEGWVFLGVGVTLVVCVAAVVIVRRMRRRQQGELLI